MFCGKCGIALPDNARFCPKCGTANEIAQSQATSLSEPEPWSEPAAQSLARPTMQPQPMASAWPAAQPQPMTQPATQPEPESAARPLSTEQPEPEPTVQFLTPAPQPKSLEPAPVLPMSQPVLRPAGQPATQPEPTIRPALQQTGSSQPRKKSKLPAFIAAAVAVLAIGIGGYFVLQNLSANPTLPSEQPAAAGDDASASSGSGSQAPTLADISSALTWGDYQVHVVGLDEVPEGAELRSFASLKNNVLELQLEYVSGGEASKGFDYKNIINYITEHGPVVIDQDGTSYTHARTTSVADEHSTKTAQGEITHATRFSLYFDLPTNLNLETCKLYFDDAYLPLSSIPKAQN